jgi:hypothetical protein
MQQLAVDIGAGHYHFALGFSGGAIGMHLGTLLLITSLIINY